MTEPVVSEGSRVRLALSDGLKSRANPAPWIGPLVALGGLASRYSRRLSGRQLIVAASVPRRDFAATLVGCGWVLASPAPKFDNPIAVLRDLEPGAPVRVVTEQVVLTDYFMQLDERGDAGVRLRNSRWLLSKISAVARLAAPEEPVRSARPTVGSLCRWAHLDATWDMRLAAPSSDLAIIGTLKWLHEDLNAVLSVVDDHHPGVTHLHAEESTIKDILIPFDPHSATWFTRLYTSSKLADQLPLPEVTRAAILDGAGAIKYLGEIESPVIICVIDRSVADEAASELIVQLRNSRGEPISLSDDLAWRPPIGVEAMAFTVAL